MPPIQELNIIRILPANIKIIASMCSNENPVACAKNKNDNNIIGGNKQNTLKLHFKNFIIYPQLL